MQFGRLPLERVIQLCHTFLEAKIQFWGVWPGNCQLNLSGIRSFCLLEGPSLNPFLFALPFKDMDQQLSSKSFHLTQ